MVAWRHAAYDFGFYPRAWCFRVQEEDEEEVPSTANPIVEVSVPEQDVEEPKNGKQALKDSVLREACGTAVSLYGLKYSQKCSVREDVTGSIHEIDSVLFR